MKYDSAITVYDNNGANVPLMESDLLSRLTRAFEDAGCGQDESMAREILLGLEYACLQRQPEGAVLDNAAAEKFIIRLLEGAGLGEVARHFPCRTDARNCFVKAAPEAIATVLAGHLSCPASQQDKVIAQVTKALNQAGISEAEPQLLLELARHYTLELLTTADENAIPELTPPDYIALTEAEFTALLPAECRQLLECRIVRYGGFSNIFLCLRLTVSMNMLCNRLNLSKPVLELALAEPLRTLARQLELMRQCVEKHLALPDRLPARLIVTDIGDFLQKHAFLEPNPTRESDYLASLHTNLGPCWRK